MLGRTLGHYTVLDKLGEGGMGVVYKARDTHLGRLVAIKVLSAAAVADPERKKRFVQEAKAASALNHPNIITIYDIDTADRLDFIAMEYVPGRTLDRLIGRKGLGLAEALKYAVQIADALSAAHVAGIIHRDLKPANLMVTDPGQVKVLDFGLAKLTEPAETDQFGPTQTLKPQTEEGVIVGTVAYMSPEQVQGKKVDARSDIFSFGSVLYEMLTGRRPFQGDTKISTLSAILHQEPPPVSGTVEGIPPELEKIITRCLRKDPDRRLQHMDDLKLALAELKEESDSGRLAAPLTPAKPARRWFLATAILASLLLIAALAAIAWWLAKPKPTAHQPTFTQLTDQPGQELFPSLSPDGKSFVYSSNASGNWDIYFQRVGGKTPVNLTKDCPADDTQPAFSPDGERIAFRSQRGAPSGPGGIFVMGATAESVRRLTDFGYNPAWSPDGKEILCATHNTVRPEDVPGGGGQVWCVDVSTGERRLVTKAGAQQPHWSPHGHRIAYWGVQKGGQRDIWTVSADGREPVAVTDDAYFDWNPMWSPDGKYLCFSSDRGGSMNLWRVPIEEKSGKALGQPEPLTTPSPDSAHLSVSRDGRRIAYVQRVVTQNLQRVGLDPPTETVVQQPVWITQGSRQVASPYPSPDGEWLTFSSWGRQPDIFVIRTDGTGLRQLTDDIHNDRYPSWSPDGKRIAFQSDRSGRCEIWTINPDGSGLQQLTYTSADAVFPVWSPDGTRLAYSIQPGNPFIMEVGKPWKQQSPQPLLPLGVPNVFFLVSSWSPDSRRLAGSLRQAGRVFSGVAVYSLESQQLQRLTDFGRDPVWLRDNRRLLFEHEGKIYLVNSQSRKAHEVLSVAPHSVGRRIALSRDDRTICFSLEVTEADIWLMTLE